LWAERGAFLIILIFIPIEEHFQQIKPDLGLRAWRGAFMLTLRFTLIGEHFPQKKLGNSVSSHLTKFVASSLSPLFAPPDEFLSSSILDSLKPSAQTLS